MANSNENTQNPKENQEKTADEGIQEHSEHTAENKQPESKNNAQKKDESTCLCKFFKKITEWMFASKNKNSKKADENAAENNDAAKQVEIKQADTVEQPKEQRKLSDYLEIFSKLIGISTVFGIFYGGVVIYFYLLKINKLSIFPDVVSNPTSLIAAISILIFTLVIIILLYYLSILLFSKLFLLIPELFLAIQNFRNPKSPKLNHSIKIMLGLSYIIIYFYIIFHILTVFLKDYLQYLFLKDDKDIYILLMPLLFLILRNFLRSNFSGLFDPNLKKFFIDILSILIILMCIILSLLINNISILNFTYFIEIPKNSSWYLLHNNFQQNKGSQEINGIDKNDLIKLKQNFKCSILSEKEKVEKDIKCSSTPEQRNNALYGYMAWNYGDTKVFCPPTTNNTKLDNIEYKDWKIPAKKLDKECIVISGKALQIMPESYISTNTDGIDGSNPDNTGHDDPATDINTDVRFKNDFNAQSNAGLNNYNIQPVLPIQSNAKNMSIQINYGSCNHDSPRNKDNHPDIGYTDKKICQ